MSAELIRWFDQSPIEQRQLANKLVAPENTGV